MLDHRDRAESLRFQNNFHTSVFLVTDDGVIATDPIEAAAATWLENEIRSRFNQEIRYEQFLPLNIAGAHRIRSANWRGN